ncbi:hypothetical protein [Streptomyces sp. NPDC047434]|uniref:hypothetical protein n=1 Tax=Streptomyces sp. NPDC047434 TaxID=3155143 RepID=UPI0033E792EF
MLRLLDDLILRDRPVAAETWHAFWDRLDGGRLDKADALAVLTSLSTLPPDAPTSLGLLDSLAARRRAHRTTVTPATWQGTVNAVGTGGGPATFNLTTAATLVAAAAGTPMVKTGSRAYTSRHGSLDMLRLLGIPLCGSYPECEDFLSLYGVAFAGGFVYPTELARLARLTIPHDIRRTGRVFNTLGPFLADLPVATQITGVSDRRDLPRLTTLALRPGAPDTWLVHNDLGVDELVSFAPNAIDTGDGTSRHVGGQASPALPSTPGTLADLAPAPDNAPDPVQHLLDLLGGHGPPPAVESICLNAAAAGVAAGTAPDWESAYRATTEAVRSGAARALVQRLRSHPGHTAFGASPIHA